MLLYIMSKVRQTNKQPHLNLSTEHLLLNTLFSFFLLLVISLGIGQMQYFIQVVPTIYEKSSGNLYDTNQYSVTYQHAEVDLKSEHIELPGKPPSSLFPPSLLFPYSFLLILSNQ